MQVRPRVRERNCRDMGVPTPRGGSDAYVPPPAHPVRSSTQSLAAKYGLAFLNKYLKGSDTKALGKNHFSAEKVIF